MHTISDGSDKTLMRCGSRAHDGQSAYRVVRWTRSAIRTVVNAGGMLAGACIVAIVAVMTIEVFSRYVLSSPTYWALEVSVYLLVATVALGSPYTLRVGGHVAVEALHQLLPPAVQKLANQLNMLIVCSFGLILVWYGLGEVHLAWRLGISSLTPMAMPLYYPQSLIPICGVLLAVQALELMIYPEYQVERSEDDNFPIVAE